MTLRAYAHAMLFLAVNALFCLLRGLLRFMCDYLFDEKFRIGFRFKVYTIHRRSCDFEWTLVQTVLIVSILQNNIRIYYFQGIFTRLATLFAIKSWALSLVVCPANFFYGCDSRKLCNRL